MNVCIFVDKMIISNYSTQKKCTWENYMGVCWSHSSLIVLHFSIDVPSAFLGKAKRISGGAFIGTWWLLLAINLRYHHLTIPTYFLFNWWPHDLRSVRVAVFFKRWALHCQFICQVIEEHQEQKGPKHRDLRHSVFLSWAPNFILKVLKKLLHAAGYLEMDPHWYYLLHQKTS